MIAMVKKLCSIHRFYYGGDVCPMCANEKYNKMYRNNFHMHSVKNVKEVDNVISTEILSKLKEKFSNK